MIEKERKFILKYMPNLGSYFNQPKMIRQGYLMLDDSRQLRVRIVNDYDCYLTYKEKIDECTRREFEYKIPYEDAVIMYETCRHKLEKKRFVTVYKEYKIEIDVYPSGKQVVEIEFEGEISEIPEYCGKEITGKKEYSNVWMAKQNKEIFPIENDETKL